MADALAHLRCKVAWCQGILTHAPGCPETPEEPVWTEPKRCGGCATQSASSADHLPQCSWLRGAPFNVEEKVNQ